MNSNTTTGPGFTDWAEANACPAHARHPYISAEQLNTAELAAVVANIGFGRGISIQPEGPVPSCYRIFPHPAPLAPPRVAPGPTTGSTSHPPDITQATTPFAVHVSVPTAASIETHLVRTKRAARYATLGWSRSALQSIIPFSGDINTEFEDTGSVSSNNAQHPVSLVSRHCFPTGVVRIDPQGQAVNSEFTKAVRAAVSSGTGAEKTTALRQVFARWGHVVATWVEVGGAKVARVSLTGGRTTAELEQRQREHEVALDTLVNTTSSAAPPTQLVLTTVGGSFFSRDNSAWKTSLLDYHVWSIISVLEVIPTYELLSDDLRRDVVSILSSAQPNLPLPMLSHDGFVVPDTNLNPKVPIPESRFVDSFTISFSFRGGSIPTSATGLLSVETASFGDSLACVWFSGANLVLSISTGVKEHSRFALASYAFRPDTWTHLALVWAVTNLTVVVYVDGKPRMTQAITDEWRNQMRTHQRMLLGFGRWKWSGEDISPWAGEIKTLRVWNQALSDAEIAHLALQS